MVQQNQSLAGIDHQWECPGTWTMSFLSCLCLETPLPVGSSEMPKGAGCQVLGNFLAKLEINVCSREMCADSAAKKTDLNKKVGLYPCHNQVVTIVILILLPLSLPPLPSGWQPVLDAVKRGRDSSG